MDNHSWVGDSVGHIIKKITNRGGGVFALGTPRFSQGDIGSVYGLLLTGKIVLARRGMADIGIDGQ